MIICGERDTKRYLFGLSWVELDSVTFLFIGLSLPQFIHYYNPTGNKPETDMALSTTASFAPERERERVDQNMSCRVTYTLHIYNKHTLSLSLQSPYTSIQPFHLFFFRTTFLLIFITYLNCESQHYYNIFFTHTCPGSAILVNCAMHMLIFIIKSFSSYLLFKQPPPFSNSPLCPHHSQLLHTTNLTPDLQVSYESFIFMTIIIHVFSSKLV